MSKIHEIKTIADFLDTVTEENLPNILVDFSNFLYIYLTALKTVKDQFPNKNNSKIMYSDFTWIDDGKHLMDFSLKSPSGETNKILEGFDMDKHIHGEEE